MGFFKINYQSNNILGIKCSLILIFENNQSVQNTQQILSFVYNLLNICKPTLLTQYKKL